MKRRIPFAVLPVIVLVAAGFGSSTSATPGTKETRGGVPWTGSPGVTVPVSAMTTRQRLVDWGFEAPPLRGRDQPEREAEGEQGEADEEEGEEGSEPGEAAAGGSKEEPVEKGAPPKGAAPTKSRALDLKAPPVGPKSELTTGTSFLGAHRPAPWDPPRSWSR
jgi:hypothetical protein